MKRTGVAGFLTLDLNANIPKAMVSNTTAIVAYRSNPHLDPARPLYDRCRSSDGVAGDSLREYRDGLSCADVEEEGASFLVVADGDEKLARRAAKRLANRAWERRSDL